MFRINSFVLDVAVSGPSDDTSSSPGRRTPPVQLVVLFAILLGEGAGLAVLTVLLIVDLLTVVPDSYASAIGITVLSAIGAAALVALAVQTVRGRPWVRGAIVTLQLIQLAIAVGCFQELVGRADLGVALLVPALLALVLLFTPPVIAATARRDG